MDMDHLPCNPHDDHATICTGATGSPHSLVFMVEMMATASVEASMDTKRPTYCQVHPEACRLKTYSMMGIMSPTLATTTTKAMVKIWMACCTRPRGLSALQHADVRMRFSEGMLLRVEDRGRGGEQVLVS